MTSTPAFDQRLLERYNRPGPRYTSYPTAPQFHAGFGEDGLRRAIAETNGDPIPAALSIYVHVPFCVSPCFYCGCNRVITRDAQRGADYLERLATEIALVAPLFDRDRRVQQLHFGGGTPNFLSVEQLAHCVDALREHFNFAQDALDVSIEIDPRFVTADDVHALRRAGFNRASLGVQDFDPTVQRAVNRVQSIEQTAAIIEACRGAGFESVNVDLIYGLPEQTLAGFDRTLDVVLQLRPDRLAVYGYAHLPHLFRPQRQIDAEALPDPHTRLMLLAQAIERLTAGGYLYIGMDHFALPDDSIAIAQSRRSLHRTFMGYTTHADTDLIGLGVSAISHIGRSFSQNPRDLPSWSSALEAGRLPVARGLCLSDDDLLRAEIIQSLMCHGEVDTRAIERRWRIRFAEYFRDSLVRIAPLERDGLVRRTGSRIQATPAGRLLLRNLAMCFDAYLEPPTPCLSAVPRYSSAV